MELAERAELLAKQLIEPLCTGATLRLQRPFGQALCQEIGPHRTIVDNELKLSVQQARICAARQVLPVDSIPELSAPEWTLAATLNDLLQSTNHELSNIVTRDRHEELAEQVTATCSQLPQPGK